MFNKHNLNIANFCAKNTTRPEITGIFIEPNRTTATDSFCLISVETPKLNSTDYPIIPNKKVKDNFKPFILPADKSKEVLRIIPKNNKSLPILEHAILTQQTETMVELTTTDLNATQSVMSQVIDGKYPEFQPLLTEKGKFIKIQLNAELLLKIAQFFVQFQSNEGITMKIPYNQNEAVRFIGINNTQKAYGLIMPIH